ncbi:sialin-like isoform X1 [Cloeon dipterum]|uniref:sialin-like isoform X1 n=1 Tax=Cloeon dipterum TaxID=197152 RepID=UPI0032209C8C
MLATPPSSADASPDEKTAIKSHLHYTQSLTEIPHHQRRSSRWLSRIQRRHVVAILAFLGFCQVYALRVNLSVAIVAMTANRTIISEGNIKTEQDFDWDSKSQGIILSSFFYGYAVTQIPGGWLATRIGGKKMFGLGILVTAIITLLTPLLAWTGFYYLVVGRIIEGIFEGVTYPSIHAVWSRWAPPLERSRLVTIAFSGSYFGTVISLPLSGYLAETFGWASIFYVFGVIAIIWCIVWLIVVSETPQEDKQITEEELDYIRATVGPAANHVKVNMDPPWKRFVTSLPVWAIMLAHFSENWGFYTLLTELPTFMNDVLGFDLKHAGLLSALPYLVMGTVVQIGGQLADYLISNGHLSTTKVRKLCTCGAFIFQTLFLIAAAHATSATAVVACLTVAVGFGGFAWAGFSVNPLDIAPQFASILMGLSNTVATLPGMISPLLTGHLVQRKTPEEWQTVFYIAGGIYLAGAVFYAMFASGKLQRWAELPDGELLCADTHSRASTEDLPFGSGTCGDSD